MVEQSGEATVATLTTAGSRLLIFIAAVGIAGMLACNDSTAPNRVAAPSDPLNELAAENVLDARIVVHAHDSLVELPSLHAPARFATVGKTGQWQASGGFTVDSESAAPRRGRPVPQGSPGPSASP